MKNIVNPAHRSPGVCRERASKSAVNTGGDSSLDLQIHKAQLALGRGANEDLEPRVRNELDLGLLVLNILGELGDALRQFVGGRVAFKFKDA